MLCQYRLIPGFQLTKKDLGYMLTPFELMNYLHQEKSRQTLFASLPPQLQRKSAITYDRGLTSLIQQLVRLVINGEWVALSFRVQNRDIHDVRLPFGSGLQRRVNNVLNPPLNRSLVTAPSSLLLNRPSSVEDSLIEIEPKNDNKIVIEFAGQWPNNAASISISKLKNINEKTQKPKKDRKNRHKSLVEFSSLDDKERSLYLTIPSINSAKEINLLLSESLSPVVKETEMEEWDNVLVPVVPFKTKNTDFIYKEASFYPSGYIYIVWNNKIWRELKITKDYRFMDIDLTSEKKESGEEVSNRFVDIALTHPKYGCYFSDEPFDVKQNGETVFSGKLDVYGQARVYDLIEDKVTIELPQTADHYSVVLETTQGISCINQSEIRPVSGHALPHIWIPYKIEGKPQTLYAYHSLSQLTYNELFELASNPSSRAQSIDGLECYTKSREFNDRGSSIITMQQSLSDEILRFSVEKQSEQGIAALLIRSPINEIVFTYCHHSAVDEPDDYFELFNTEYKWSQKVYLAQASILDDHYKLIRFSGWPNEVEKVTLKRVNKGNEYHPEQPPIIIYQDIAISELV